MAGKHGGERDMAQEAELLGEYNYYLSCKPELLLLFEGRFALIKERKLIGIFDTHRAAHLEGRRRLGNVPMLIHRIEREEEVVWLPGFQVSLSDDTP